MGNVAPASQETIVPLTVNTTTILIPMESMNATSTSTNNLGTKGTILASDSTNSEDGFKWRKYGQKKLKGTTSPRHYYKCTYPGCHVKKSVERIEENGKYSEKISYKGDHLHDSSRIALLSPFSHLINPSTQTTTNSISNSNNSNTSSNTNASTNTNTNTNTKTIPSTNVKTSTSNSDTKNTNNSSTNIVVENSSTNSTMTDNLTNSTNSTIADNSNNSTNSTIANNLVTNNLTSISILEDGFCWRKYGQKNVKNGTKRSYYKCTEITCTAKKQVEKFETGIKTSYEGSHNHSKPFITEARKKRRGNNSLIIIDPKKLKH